MDSWFEGSYDGYQSPNDREPDSVLKFISQVLMEDDTNEERPSMMHTRLALQAAEKPFYDALGKDYPLSDHTNMFTDEESMIQFQKGVEEANKFLPQITNLDLDTPPIVEGLSGRRIHFLDGEDLEDGRNRKRSVVSVEDEADEVSEMFDRVLLSPKKEELPKGEHLKDKQGLPNMDDSGKDSVDLGNMLILSARAVAADDLRTATELLKKIRRHSSPFDGGAQRLAHYFANALEARIAGTGSHIYSALASKRTTAAELLKAHRFYMSFCPFTNVSYLFCNQNILKISERRKKLHIIDFGIYYGFQWPSLIQSLSERPEGPPVLRITGVELPEPGYRPAEWVEGTGRRLKKYCERFGVQFEFQAIAQKWETVRLEDLKLERDEVVVVNSVFRFKHLLDETTVVDSPRDAFLSLIRKIKPRLFVQAAINGSFNAPFFFTRFREALFYYTTLFDLFDAKVEREHWERMMFERDIYGIRIMNVVACEGMERVERPETYKQWQVIFMRAGFRRLPLDPKIMQKARLKMAHYDMDYSLDGDGNWAVMGWKGRVCYAASAWVPS